MKTSKMKPQTQIRDFDSYYELIEYFSTEQKCIEHLATIRWNGKPECPYCQHDHVYHLKGANRRWKCAKCRKHFSVRVGTIFEDSNIPLRKWFLAIYLITSHKKGISSCQLARDLKLTQKSAWFLLHRVRHGFTPEIGLRFTKTVEIDETLVGGRERNKHANKRSRDSIGGFVNAKIPVLGIIERGGKVFAIPVKDIRRKTMLPIVKDLVAGGTKIYTDDNPTYDGLRYPYYHHAVNHSAREYVSGDVHTNNIESFWAIVKRTIYGIYHKVSEKHLAKYINECTFRFNNRELSEGSRFDVLLANSQGRLDYVTLTGAKEAK